MRTHYAADHTLRFGRIAQTVGPDQIGYFVVRRSDEVALEGPGSRPGPARHADLVEDVADVARDRLLADEQLLGDCPVRFASGDQPKDLSFTLGERKRRTAAAGGVLRNAR